MILGKFINRKDVRWRIILMALAVGAIRSDNHYMR